MATTEEPVADSVAVGQGPEEAAPPEPSPKQQEEASKRDARAADVPSNDPAAMLLDEIDNPDGVFSRKRRLAEPESSAGGSSAKRPRLDDSGVGAAPEFPAVSFPVRARQLPDAVWHRVFTFLDPISLGRLLSVNKRFHKFLDPSSQTPSSPVSSNSCLAPLKPDAIWQASRRLLWPRMPAPLKGRSELAMWRLAALRCCQFCGHRDLSEGSPLGDQWHRGPGAKGVSPVFSFSIVCCGNCLTTKSLKEVDLLLSSSTPSILLPALPMIFVSADLHVIPLQALQDGIASTQNSISKLYWADQVESIKSEFESVKLLGQAAAEEWLKGLDARGKLALADASRWEKWYFSGGRRALRSRPRSEGSAEKANNLLSATIVPSAAQGNDDFAQHGNEGVNGDKGTSAAGLTGPALPMPVQLQKRTKEQADELTTQRRIEIERRALLLNPPLTPSTLSHMPSFRAAIQLTSPLDDQAWEFLMPRLLSQREAAEQRERHAEMQKAADSSTAPARPENTAHTLVQTQSVKEASDNKWDEVQGPLRARISEFADEIIRDGWAGGITLNKKDCPQFVAEVLVYIRKRFYAEVAEDAVAAAVLGRASVVEPAAGPWTRKLTLENLKWVFDTKIRPLTSPHRKELFLCNECPSQSKFYALEAVIQHYAAKHTAALSAGSVIVHWRAEWPEKPPFNPDPKLQMSKPQSNESGNSHHAVARPHPVYGPNTPGTAQSVYFTPSTVPNLDGHLKFTQPNAQPILGGANVGGIAPSQHVQHGQLPLLHSPVPAPASRVAPHSNSREAADAWQGSAPNVTSNIWHAQPNLSSKKKNKAYRSRFDTMVQVVKGVWKKLKGNKNVPSAVRACVVVHNIAKKFQDTYSEAASLDLFIDGLAHHKEMQPIRSISMILCKTCQNSVHTGSKGAVHSFAQLVRHFKAVHVDEAQLSGLASKDWRIDMIQLPDMSVLRQLQGTLKNTVVRDLVADTLPWAFGPGDIQSTSSYPADDAAARSGHGQQQAYSAPAGTKRSAETTNLQPPSQRRDSNAPQRLNMAPPKPNRPDLRSAAEVYGTTRETRSSHATDLYELRNGRQTAAFRPTNFGDHSYGSATGPELPSDRYDRVTEGAHPSSAAKYMMSQSQPRGAPASSNGWTDGRVPPGRTSQPAAPPMPPPVRPDTRFYGEPGAFEPLAASSRENMRPADVSYAYPGREPYYAGEYDPVSDRRGRSRSPRGWARDEHSGRYRERSPMMSVGASSFVARGPLPPSYGGAHLPGYGDAQQHQLAPPAQAYEIVEVRDPRGDYIIKRPIGRVEQSLYAHGTQAVPSAAEPYPRAPMADHHSRGRASTAYGSDTRPVGAALPRPPPRPDFEEYDPRYPAVAAGPRHMG